MFKFVSGWAGYKELFPYISSHHDFYVPFITHTEAEISKELAKGGEILAGWSTGAHIILKNIDLLADKYENIFLFAPFNSFTEYQNSKTVMLMIRKLKKEPSVVLNDFYNNCGIMDFNPEIDETAKMGLIKGLEFLIESKSILKGCSLKAKLTLVHGLNDIIVNHKASKDITDYFDSCKLISLDSGHYINEQKIADIIYENTHKKIF
jgi:predicted alpha/beta hydrolase family esterase